MSGSHARLSRFFDTPNKKAFSIIFFFCIVWLVVGAKSSELYSDDDLSHFMMARYAPHHPLLFLDIWGRPVFTILYSLGSQLGIMGARATSAVIGGIVCWLSYVYARERGYNRPWLIPLLLAAMPRFSSTCYTLDTGLMLALVLSGALALYAYGRENLSALAISLAPAARPEGVLFIGIFAVAFLYRRKWSAIPLLAAGLLAWDMAGFAYSGDPLWLLHNQPWTVPYPFKFGLMYYFQKLTEITGPVHVPLFLAGMVYYFYRWKEGDNALILSGWLALFVFLAIAVWLGAFATVGLTRYFNGTTPLVALLSLAGLNRVLGSRYSLIDAVTGGVLVVAVPYLLINHASGAIALVIATAATVSLRVFVLKGGSVRTAGNIALAGLLVFVGVNFNLPDGSYNEEHEMIKEASLKYILKSPGRFTLSSTTWFCYFTDKDPYDKSQNLPVTEENLVNAPAGTVVIWEPHYAGGERYGNIAPQRLLSDPNFQFKWMDDEQFSMIFEKTGAAGQARPGQ